MPSTPDPPPSDIAALATRALVLFTHCQNLPKSPPHLRKHAAESFTSFVDWATKNNVFVVGDDPLYEHLRTKLIKSRDPEWREKNKSQLQRFILTEDEPEEWTIPAWADDRATLIYKKVDFLLKLLNEFLTCALAMHGDNMELSEQQRNDLDSADVVQLPRLALSMADPSSETAREECICMVRRAREIVNKLRNFTPWVDCLD